MIFYQMNLPKTYVEYAPAISRLVSRSKGKFDATETKTEIIYEIAFPDKITLDTFKEAVHKRMSKKMY
ncbi:MAG TPA: hypothetical protein VGB43_03290 [Flavobacterium sp.]